MLRPILCWLGFHDVRTFMQFQTTKARCVYCRFDRTIG